MSRNPERRDRARQLRRAMTPAEAIMWKHLRGRRFAGFKFRQQHPVGPFFADIVCHHCRLIVELDGETHLGQQEHDEKRSQYLRERGWLVLRFWNTQVYDETEAVFEAIYRACQDRKTRDAGSQSEDTPSPPTPLPRPRGRGEKKGRRHGASS
ncbi:MAG: DUF559 domain-containing protein [Gemmataceae bacterium]|nr:DUF559 domain-containing protein [Gemmataceae bacterium]